MIDMNAMLLCDTYKTVHHEMYPEGLEYLTSYWIPRKSMLEAPRDRMVFFGLQAFLQEYLIDYFDSNFFHMPVEDVLQDYTRYMDVQLPGHRQDLTHIRKLHELGYLPLQIRAMPEGTVVNMGTPCIEVSNTVAGFAWLVQWIECVMQADLWKLCTHASIGHQYYRLAADWYGKTSEQDPMNACSDFGMRGMSCMEEAARCSAAWLLSFNKTSTIPALAWLEKYYMVPVGPRLGFGTGAVSTEHSVISSNTAAGCDEAAFLKKMLTEIYPGESFSYLADTYDYWNFINNVLPACRDEIMQHNGKLLVRPDSGDQVDIVCLTIPKLLDMFGGKKNGKGYMELDPHIGLILGDGATQRTVERIWRNLEKLGISASSLVFGVGAFPFSAFQLETGRDLVCNTRDTYGIAMKAAYGKCGDRPILIYKDPKTDSSLKRSPRGLCRVDRLENGDFICTEQQPERGSDYKDALRTVFIDGTRTVDETFQTIRSRLLAENVKYNL